MVVPVVGPQTLTHARKVCSLYKRALRVLYGWTHHSTAKYRYNCVLLRARFDENRNVKDAREAKKLLEAGERELFQNNVLTQGRKYFTYSPGGVAYEREVVPPDWVLDYWHPLEKAQYPEYFARREIRKKEFIEMWEKQYGKPSPEDTHH